jgi:hypothetical protein
MQRLDEPRLLRVVREGAANLAHRHLQDRVADVNAGPHDVQQLVLRHDPVRMADEVVQDGECLRRQDEPPPLPLDRGGARVEAERRKDVHRVGVHGRDANLTSGFTAAS